MKTYSFRMLAGIAAEHLAKIETELKRQHADLSAALSQEQGRWAAFNPELAELERLFQKRK